MKIFIAVLSTTLLISTSITTTAASPAASADKPATSGSVEKPPMTEGEIKKIDKDLGKVTIKHGEIKNLDMPPMTMVFRMKDAAMLDKVKVGDKINFSAEKLNGNFTVTKVEAAK
jgi:Cu(I)/Ag(I) efflux system periplasmic protein CusF